MGILIILFYIAVWGYVIYGIANAKEPLECDKTDCDTCPFPCEEHDK